MESWQCIVRVKSFLIRSMKIKKLGYTNKFKKDYKRILKQNKDVTKLERVVKFLETGQDLPQKYKNHRLIGDYSGYWECHIEPDWLLIYENEEESIVLVRTGSHAMLFD